LLDFEGFGLALEVVYKENLPIEHPSR
jgi:hypothetical protein